MDDDAINILLKRIEQLENIILRRLDTIDSKLTAGIECNDLEKASAEIEELLESYLKGRLERDPAKFNKTAFTYQPAIKNGLIYVFLQEFRRYVLTDHAKRLESADIVRCFSFLKIKRTTVKATNPRTGKGTTRSAYVLPDTWTKRLEK